MTGLHAAARQLLGAAGLRRPGRPTGRKRWVTKTVIGGKREAHRALVADNDRGAHSHTNATVGKLLEEGIALAELATRPRAPGTDAA